MTFPTTARAVALAILACAAAVLLVAPSAFATAPPNGLTRAETRAADRVLDAAEDRGVGALAASPFLQQTACGRAARPVQLAAKRHRTALGALRRVQRSGGSVGAAQRRVTRARAALSGAAARRARACAPRARTTRSVGEGETLQGTSAPQRPAAIVSGTGMVVALPVDFGDRPALRVRNTPARYDQLLFGDYPHGGGSLARFYEEMSAGAFTVDGDVAPWRRMPRSRAAYANDAGGMGAYPSNSQSLLEDAVRANDAAIDFARYDNDGPDGRPNSGDDDGFVDSVFLVFAGTSAAENGNLDTMWPHAWQRVVATRDASANGGFVRVGRYAAVPERMEETGPDGDLLTVGVVAHEYGHVLGLPDLVDGDSAPGAGRWDVMGSGMWGFEHSSRPSGMSAWSRARLGWTTPRLLEGDHPAHELGTATPAKLPIAGEPLHEHFLVERRTRTGFDADLPGDGLLVWHVDDSISIAGGAHPRVELVPADGSAGGDRGDLFGPGATLADSTSPSTRAHDGGESLVVIQNAAGAPGTTVDLHAGTASLAPRIDAAIDDAGPRAAFPTATLTAPTEGARLRGVIPMTCTGTGAPNINRLSFRRGATTMNNTTINPTAATATRTYNYNSGTTNGPMALSCVARNTSFQTTTSAEVNVVLDNTVPTTPTISTPAAGTWVRGTVPFTATGTDNYGVTSMSFRVDGVDDWQPAWLEETSSTHAFNWDTTTATNGSHALTVRSQDLAGGISAVSATRTVNVDNALPTLAAPTDGATLPDIDQRATSTTLDARWTAGTDADSGIAGYAWRFCDDPTCTTVVASGAGPGLTASAGSLSLAVGTYHACVQAIDVAGNQSVEQCSDGVVVDDVAPTMAIPDDGPTAPDLDSQASLTTLDASWAAADDGAGTGVASYDWRFCPTIACGVILASGSGTGTSATAGSLTLTAGVTYYACVRASDQLANVSGWTCSDGIIVDGAPAVSITSPTSGSGVPGSGTVNVDATAADPGGGIVQFEWRLDGVLQQSVGPLAALSPRSSTWAWNTLAVSDGAHTIEVTAFDSTGLTATDTVNVIVDRTAPATSHGGIASGAIITGSVGLTSSSSDANGVDRVEYRIDGATVATASAGGATSFTDPGTPFSTTSLLDGNHGFRVATFDIAGNRSFSSPSTSFVVNNNVEGMNPSGTLTSPAAGGLGATNVTLAANVADDNVVVKVEFLLDGAAIAGVAPVTTAPGFAGGTVTRSWVSTAGVAVGSHTLTARVTDASGNTYVTPGVVVTK